MALSFGAVTLPVVGLVWLAGVNAGAAFLAVTGLTAAVVLCRHIPVWDATLRERKAILLLAAAWLVLVLASLVDWGDGDRLWMSVVTYDHSLRTSFVDAVLRSGVPPASPVYWPGHDTPMRYYYFWYVLCAAVARLAHITARQALIASCVWPFFGLSAMVALFQRHVLGWRGAQLRRGHRLGTALFAVTGLDLLATAGDYAGNGRLHADMEWWAWDQVTSWVDSFLWVPHHDAALICCLMTVLLLWLASQKAGRAWPWQEAIVAGLSFAAAFGLSTYVAAATAGLLLLWLAWNLLHKRSALARPIAIAAVVATTVLIPYVAQLHTPEGSARSSGHVLTLGVRRGVEPSDILQALSAVAPVQQHPLLSRTAVFLAVLLPCYFTEFGFFAVVLVFAQKARGYRSESEKTLLFWTWSGLLISTFVCSVVITTNDFGMRSILLPQFFLLLLGPVVLERAIGWRRKLLLATACIGVAGSMYQVALLRFYLPVQEGNGNPNFRDIAERNFALRDAYDALHLAVPTPLRMQYDVSRGGYYYFSHMLSGAEQVITAEPECNVSFGGDPAACPGIQRDVPITVPASEQACTG